MPAVRRSERAVRLNVSYVFIRLVQGRAKDIHPLMYVVALAFVMFFGVGVIEGWAA